MLCTACGCSFSFFKKQHSCPICGFIFCGKCCSNKTVVPSIHPQHKQALCKKCFNQLTSASSAPICPPSPPAAFKKRLEQSDGTHNTKGSPKIPTRSDHAQGPTEKELRERLSKLKHVGSPQTLPNMVAVPTEQELSDRLSKLKHVETRPTPPPVQVASILLPGKKVSETEQAGRLIQQLQEEVALDARRPPPEVEVEARLRKLKEDWPLVAPPPLIESGNADLNGANGTSDSQSSSDSDSEKEEKDVNDLMNKFLSEAELDSRVGRVGKVGSVESSSYQAEYVSCAMCSNPASMECPNCDCDLYCPACYKEWHQEEDTRQHRALSFKQPCLF